MSEILDAIENVVRDYETSPDAMRWAPDGTATPTRPNPMEPAPRVEHIEIKVRTSDGREHTVTMTGAEEVELSMDWEDDDPGPWLPSRITPRERRLETFAMKVLYPSGLEQTAQLGD